MAEAAKPEQPQEAPKKKPPIKLIAIVGAVMLAEAAAVVLLVGSTGPKPQAAVADIQGDGKTELHTAIEIPLVDDRFQNMQTGRVWSWDIAIVLKVKSKNEEHVKHEMEKRNAEIKEGVSQIIRKAQHNHLKEPELTTLSRQLTAYLQKTFGKDPDGETRIERIIIPKCKGIQLEN